MNENISEFGDRVRELTYELVDFLNKNQKKCEGYTIGNIQLNALINVLSKILYKNKMNREKSIEAISNQIREFFIEMDNHRGSKDKNVEMSIKQVK